MDTISTIRASLGRRKGEWPTICAGTGLSYHWLTKLAQGRIAEPGLGKVERLQQYLADNPEAPETGAAPGSARVA